MCLLLIMYMHTTALHSIIIFILYYFIFVFEFVSSWIMEMCFKHKQNMFYTFIFIQYYINTQTTRCLFVEPIGSTVIIKEHM